MIKVCPVCDKEFEDKKHPNAKYCSRQCCGKAHQKDIVGKKFNKLLVLKEVKTKYRDRYFLCRCDCGNEKIIRGKHLTSNKIVSCGCYQKEICGKTHITHGLTNSRLYSIYKDIIKRCTNKNHSTYKNYGARGITICNEWKNDFMSFYNWAISNGYNDSLTIDRIDNNGNYEPNNCHWCDRITQANNTRRNHFLTFNGKTQTIAQWGRELNMNSAKIGKRINLYGWSVEKALTTP